MEAERKLMPQEVAECLRACVPGVSPGVCEGCAVRRRSADGCCLKELHGAAADAIDELVRQLRRHEGVARDKTCGSCRNFIRDPGRSTGRCRIRRYLRNRWGQENGREFIPTQSRIACKTEYIPIEQEERKT